MRTPGDTGSRNEIELFKGLLAHLVQREVPALSSEQALELVDDVMRGHGSQLVTGESSLSIVNEAMGAAHAAGDRLRTGRTT